MIQFAASSISKHATRKNRAFARGPILLLACCVLISCIFIHFFNFNDFTNNIINYRAYIQQSVLGGDVDLSYIHHQNKLKKEIFVKEINKHKHDKTNVKWYTLSIIVITRNNQYLGDSISRFLHFLQQVALYDWQWDNTGLNSDSIEVIVVQYNNDPSLPNLRHLSQFARLENETKITIRWLNIDQKMHQQIIQHEWLHSTSYNQQANNDDPFLQVESDFYKHCKMLEFVAKNMAARRSASDMLLFTTSDMIFPIKLLKFFNFNLNSKFLRSNTLVITTRDTVTLEQLITLNKGSSNNNSVECPCRLETNEQTNSINNDDILDIETVFGTSSQLTACNGDFHFVFKDDFAQVFGYSQAPMVWSIDSDFCNRVRFLYNFTVLELKKPYKLKHQWHELHGGSSLPAHGKHTCNLNKQTKADSWRFESYVNRYFENGSVAVRDDKTSQQFFQQKTPHSFYIKRKNWGLPSFRIPQTVWHSKNI